MGLHIDPVSLDTNVSLREAEVKRRMWWTVAGMDALLCVSFGRPSAVNYCTTCLPVDIPDHKMDDTPGSAILSPRTPLDTTKVFTNNTYHASIFQLTIPSFQILDSVYRMNGETQSFEFNGQRMLSKSVVHRPASDPYIDALRLSREIESWYDRIPAELRFDADVDTAEVLLVTRTAKGIKQTLALCIKTWMLVLILHRPYLRGDPLACPESAEISSHAAHMILCAYKAMAVTKCSIAWSWWTMAHRVGFRIYAY